VNRLRGRITAVESAGHVLLVDVAVDDKRFSAILLEAAGAERLQPGAAVTLAFKETEVSLAKNLSGLISLRNRMRTRVRAVEKGKVLAKVTLDYHGAEVVSVITTRSAERLDLKPGDEVEALVKANEMTILPEETAP
jgi:molybdate transport system regulatory protein